MKRVHKTKFYYIQTPNFLCQKYERQKFFGYTYTYRFVYNFHYESFRFWNIHQVEMYKAVHHPFDYTHCCHIHLSRKST